MMVCVPERIPQFIRRMRILPYLVVLLLVAGCASRPSAQDFTERWGNFQFFESDRPSKDEFRKLLSATMQGDDAALKEVIFLRSQADGEGTQAYSMLLFELRSIIGRSRFDTVVDGFSLENREELASRLKYGRAFKSQIRGTRWSTGAGNAE